MTFSPHFSHGFGKNVARAVSSNHTATTCGRLTIGRAAPPQKPGARRFSGRVGVPDHAGRKPGGEAEAPAPQGNAVFVQIRGPQVVAVW
jgi:hypothetical protein